MLWRAIRASGLAIASASIATAATWTTARGTHVAPPPHPGRQDQDEHGPEHDLDDDDEQPQPGHAEGLDVQVHPAQRRRDDTEGREAQHGEGDGGDEPVPRGGPGGATGGDRDDHEGERGHGDELTEAAARVLGVAEAGGLLDVAVPADESADLHEDERSDERVEGEHRQRARLPGSTQQASGGAAPPSPGARGPGGRASPR